MPTTPGVLCLFWVLDEGEADVSSSRAASLLSIPSSFQMRWESVDPALQHPSKQCHQPRVAEPLMPLQERAAGVRF